MPQMNPMNWMLLMMLFYFSKSMMNIITYFEKNKIMNMAHMKKNYVSKLTMW